MILSIIVPVYNVEKYLQRCVESLVDIENISRYEIILVDDGSTDSSCSLCDEFAKNYSNIKVIHKENGGLSDARNAGIRIAVGEYLMFVDSDDYIRQNSIKKIIDILDVSTQDVICCNVFWAINGEKKEYNFSIIDGECDGQSFLYKQCLNNTFQIAVWHNFYKRKFIIENELFFKKGIYHEDEEWTPRTFLAAKKVVLLNERFYVYEIRENSIMSQKDLSKHFFDMGNTLVDFIAKYKYKIDEDVYKLLKDRLTDRYLSIYAKGKLFKNKVKVLPSKVLKEDLIVKKTKLKFNIFRFNKRLYCALSSLYLKRSLRK